MTQGLGWAVTAKDTILVETVSPTRRAAIVNWLVVYCQQMISNNMTDADIEARWNKYRRTWETAPRDSSIQVVEVTINVIQ